MVSISEDGIPEGWDLVSMPTGPIAIEAGGSEALVFRVAVPANALGDAFVDLPLTITSVEDGNVTVNGGMRVEASDSRPEHHRPQWRIHERRSWPWLVMMPMHGSASRTWGMLQNPRRASNGQGTRGERHRARR